MSINEASKINQLIARLPSGVVVTSAWLVTQGYSLGLQRRYRSSQWFDAIGQGAMIRRGDEVDWLGGVYALQTQLGLDFHPGASTALAMQGRAHFLPLSSQHTWLFGSPRSKLPKWFQDYDWSHQVQARKSKFLPSRLGMRSVEYKGFSIKISGAARAMLECLYLAPQQQSLEAAAELMDGLNNLRPALVEQLLLACTSNKVKRLFLYLAERSGHDWLQAIDQTQINLGQGKRSLVASGVYVPAYKITVPASLEHDHA